MMKEKTLLLLLDFIFKKEKTKTNILKVEYMGKLFHAWASIHISQPWYTTKQKLKGAFEIWSLKVDCGIVLKSAHLQHQTKVFSSASALLLLFLSIYLTFFSSSLRSEMRWEKLPAEGLFYRRLFTRWEPSLLKQKSHIPVQGHPCRQANR